MLTLIMAVCFTVLSWTLCYTIFNKPEVPRHYGILKKFGRLPIHTNYAITEAPKLPTSEATKVRNQFLALNKAEAYTINSSLMRSYLTNFDQSTFSSYLKGSFKVMETRALTKDDLISEGFVIKLQAYTQPDEYTDPSPYPVIAEIIFSTRYPEAAAGFHKGDMLKLNVTPYFAAILNAEKIERADDDTIVTITVISLGGKGGKIKPPHAGPFDLKPPHELNLKAKLPMFDLKSKS